jgi:hypothetical protein
LYTITGNTISVVSVHSSELTFQQKDSHDNSTCPQA